MQFTTCHIPGLLVVEPKVFEDSRGYFFESFNQKLFAEHGIDCQFVQDNQSKSSYGVIRGLHFQENPHSQAKLVRVLNGSILDVAVDIRKDSPTYGKHFSIELTSDNKKQLWVPAGFAHGFSVLSETAIVLYKCDQFYNKASEGGVRWDDIDLNIDWRIPTDKAVISEKDQKLPSFKDLVTNFHYT